MSHSTYFISDTHFGRANILTFTDDKGNPVRSFSSVEEMDEHMVKQWNSVVKPGDRVYHLGDVVINKKFLPIMQRLNGRKKLIMGNHDIFGAKKYLEYFEDVQSYRAYPEHGLVLSHIPVHESQLERRFKVNVHGHLHTNLVEKSKHHPDNRYLSVCVEKINYTPVSLERHLS